MIPALCIGTAWVIVASAVAPKIGRQLRSDPVWAVVPPLTDAPGLVNLMPFLPPVPPFRERVQFLRYLPPVPSPLVDLPADCVDADEISRRFFTVIGKHFEAI